MKMKFALIIIFLVLIFSGKSYSQQNEFTGGSPYSIFGIGDVNYYSSTRTYSMGIMGTSLFGNYVNTFNPAALTKLKNTIISTNFNYGFLRSSSGNSVNNVSDGNVLGLNLGIPFDQVRGWGLSIGFNPYSLVNYKVLVDGNAGGQDFTQTYSGNGGLSRLNVGMCYNIIRKISIGVEYDYAFGTIERINYINFNNASYTNSVLRSENSLEGSIFKAGAIFEIGKLLNNFAIRDLSLGIAYQSGANLSSDQIGIYRTSANIDTVTLNQGETIIPYSYSIGISNLFGKKYLVSADLLIQDWSRYSSFNMSNPNFTSGYRAGLGMEIRPNPDNFSFFGSMSYRFGGFYEKFYYRVADQDVTGFGIRAGVNIPISTYNSFDFGFNYSVKGKNEPGLIKDEFLNFTLAVNFGELWFIRPRDEDK
ncbi:MAG TPA: hypothetical protein PKD83_00210 [Ignavibacteria bacterium]|nr:hypothetical protein [Ignavibacteria bacterium]